MKWLLNLVLAATIAVGGLLSVPQMTEASPAPQQGQTRYYHVYYRISPSSPWVDYGYTASYNDAVWYSNWLRTTYGYETYIG